MDAPRFLVFDLDGTISDPAVGIGRSINYALEHFGYASMVCFDGQLSPVTYDDVGSSMIILSNLLAPIW